MLIKASLWILNLLSKPGLFFNNRSTKAISFQYENKQVLSANYKPQGVRVLTYKMGNLRSRRKAEKEKETKTVIIVPKLLSSKEKKRLKKTWHLLGQNQEVFLREVWITAAGRSPRVKSILGLDEDANNERFINLNRSVRDFFQKLIVTHKLHNERILEECYLLGIRHSQFHENVFQPIYWDIFLVSLVETMEKTDLKGIADQKRWCVVYTWHKFVHLVVNQMLEAYRGTRIGDACTTEEDF